MVDREKRRSVVMPHKRQSKEEECVIPLERDIENPFDTFNVKSVKSVKCNVKCVKYVEKTSVYIF